MGAFQGGRDRSSCDILAPSTSWQDRRRNFSLRSSSPKSASGGIRRAWAWSALCAALMPFTNINQFERLPSSAGDEAHHHDDHFSVGFHAVSPGTTSVPEDADWLLSELERATVVPQDGIPEDVVRMNSAVLFRTEAVDERSVELVFPKDADVASRKLSVLTPVGSALIG